MAVSQDRLHRMWRLVAVLFSIVVGIHADDVATANPTSMTTFSGTSEMLYFGLPSMSMTLDVEKEDDAILPFQDALTENLEGHLEKFYRNKLLTTAVGIPTFVDVDLESRLLWTELSLASHAATFTTQYEVKGVFNGKIKVRLDPIMEEGYEKPVQINDSLMDLFFLEAFEDDNYHWDLLTGFLATPLLQNIINVDIQVLDSGYVHPYDEYGNLVMRETDDDFLGKSIVFDYSSTSSSKRGAAHYLKIIGIVFATVFCVSLVALWSVLLIAMKGTNGERFRLQLRRFLRRFLGGYCDDDSDDEDDGSSVTGSTNSTNSLDLQEHDDDDDRASSTSSMIAKNLDAWAKNITSIQLRKPKKKKKRASKVVKRPYFRPSDEHTSSLGCITEADNESQCSSVRSTSTWRKTRFFQRNATAATIQEETPLAASDSFDAGESSSTHSALTSIIYEEESEADAENDDDEEQTSSLMIQRQLIKLIPSEDEEDDSSRYSSFGEI